MDYYGTLGLTRGASDADIKKAYRSLAMKHHPDRGGDEAKFKEINAAYEALSNPEKKQIIDMGGDPNAQGGGYRPQGNPFDFHFGSGNFEDIFGNFGFSQRPMQRNKSLNIGVSISFAEVLSGKELNAEVGIPGGKSKIITISIPPGIEHGQQIRYQGMGDDSIPSVRAGDLIVNVSVAPHHIYRRDGESLIYEHRITAWEAMLGSSIEIETLDKKTLQITIPPGTQPETVLSCRGEGFPHIRSKQRGNLLIKLKVSIPKNFTPEQIQKIQEIKNGI